MERRSAQVARPYPDAYFVNRDKGEHGLLDLSDRVFARAALERRTSGANKGRTTFELFVERNFEGWGIRSWTFYHTRSITRQLLHESYRHNLRGSARLRWQAQLSLDVLHALRAHAEEISPKYGPSLWRLRELGLAARLTDTELRECLRHHPDRSITALTTTALQHLGVATHGLLTDHVAAAIGGPPAEDEVELPPTAAPGASLLSRPLTDAYARLSHEDQELLTAVGEGLSYDEIVARHPRYRNRQRLSEAVRAVNAVFVEIMELALERTLPDLKPKRLMQLIFAALVDLLPALTPLRELHA